MQVKPTVEERSTAGVAGPAPRYRNRRAALTLLVLGPVVAELAFGSTPLHLAFLLVLWLPIYGAGVLLIREAVVRSGGGWASILLLGVAYELVEDGIGLQALSSPHLYHAADWGPRLLGLNTTYWELNVAYHVVFSVAIPILLVGLIFPSGRGRPYLGRLGLAVTAAVMLLGVAILRLTVPFSQDPGYTAPATVLIGCVVAVVVIAAVALWVLPRRAVRPRDDEPVPSLTALGLLGASATIAFITLLFVFTGAHRPGLVRDGWVLGPMAVAAAIAGGVALLVRRWSGSRRWGDAQMLWLAGGALIAHTVFGAIGIAQSTLDRVGLVVLGLLTIWLLVALRRRLTPAADQSAPADLGELSVVGRDRER
jgi:hypothetical protein